MGYSNSKVAKEIKERGFCYPMNPVLASITFLVSLAALGVVIYEFYCMQVEGDFVRMKKWMYAFNYANAIGTGKKSQLNMRTNKKSSSFALT